MRACLFGTYNRSHSANRVLANALEACGYEVVEIHRPLWERTRDKPASYFAPLGLVRLGLQWIVAAVGLARDWQRSGGAPIAAVGFNGQLDLLLLRLIAPRHGPKIVFAPLVSICETLVDDRGVYRPESPAGRLFAALDRLACRAADVVVVDSEAHANYFNERLRVPREKLQVCYLGVDTKAFPLTFDGAVPTRESAVGGGASEQTPTGARAPFAGTSSLAPRGRNAGREGENGSRHRTVPEAQTGELLAQGSDRFTEEEKVPSSSAPAREGVFSSSPHHDVCEVLYFGQYLPLHGLDVIAGAVEALAERRDLRFVFIGTGELRASFQARLSAYDANTEFVDWVAYEKLAERIARADIVLGIFGGSVKARMVIPNKVYEAAAVGRAVVTADTPAVRELFTADENVVVCDADSASLAAAITRLVEAPDLRRRLGEAARSFMAERFSDAAVAVAWAPALTTDDDAPYETSQETARLQRVGVAILNYRNPVATLACVDSLLADPQLRTGSGLHADILVVDNGGQQAEADGLQRELCARSGVRLLRLPSNLGYAGGNNRAMQELFAAGADAVLLLNDDTRVVPGAVAAMLACARREARAGLVGPTVLGDRLDGAAASVPASIGERCWPALAWLPRRILRYRRRRQRPYPVKGLLGCALLVRRDAFEKLGGLEESYFAYYEEVDYCLRARAAGLSAYVAPGAEVSHSGHRGFAGGMTLVSAYLKARNLWLLAQRRTSAAGRVVFVPGYAALLALSMGLYAVSGQSGLARALWAGALAGLRGETGAPPARFSAGGETAGAERSL